MNDTPKLTCSFCGLATPYPCRNTRDMQENAVLGQQTHCYDALKNAGGGEQGMDYVDRLIAAKEKLQPKTDVETKPSTDALPRKKVSYVGVPAYWELQMACQELVRAYSNGKFAGCFLVGSALERPDWRDVDIRFMLDDDEFNKLFPDAKTNWEADPRWLITCSSISLWMAKRTGLPIDFQFQPMTYANKTHGKAAKKPRHSIGLIFEREKSDAEL